MVTIAYRGSAGKSGTLGADPVVDLSGIGIQNNDFMVAVCRAGGAIVAPIGGGWTTAPSSLGVTNPLFWRKWVTGDATSFTFTTTGAVNSIVNIGVWSGVHTSSPVDDSDGIDGTGALVIPSVDAADINRLLVMLAVKLQNTTFTFSAGTERYDAVAGTQNFVYAGADEAIGSGATGSRTATPASGASNGVAYMLALRPAVTDYTVSSDLVGVGVVTENLQTALSRNPIGVGVVTESLQGGMSRDITGVGVTTDGAKTVTHSDMVVGVGIVSETLQNGLSRDLTGVGVVADGAKTITHSETVSGVGVVDDGKTVNQSAKDLTGIGIVSPNLETSMNTALTGVGQVTESGKTIQTATDLTGVGEVTPVGLLVVAIPRDLLGVGTIDYTKAAGLARTFNLTGVGQVRDTTLAFPYDHIPVGPSDWSPNDGLKTISGVVFFHEPPNQGDPVSGATVTLIRDSDGFKVGTTGTAVDGTYSFPRDTNDPYTYHVEVNWTDGGTPQQGLSEGGCVPS